MRKFCLLLSLVLLTGCAGPAAEVPTTDSVENPWVSIEFYAVNDLHGKVVDSEIQPGVDELSTYLEQNRTENTILLSTGDMWQGASESNLTKGFLVTQWMNEMGFHAMTLGGHEYDWGEEWIQKNKDLAQFPFLGINVYSRATDQRVSYCQSSLVVDMDGVQVGIIGAIGDCYNSIASEYSKDLYFKTGKELTELVKAESQKLRNQGVDFIVYTLHDGDRQTSSDTQAIPVEDGVLAGYYDTELSQGYVDLVFEADSHYWYVLEDSCGVFHLQAGANNNGLSYARVLVNKQSGEATVVSAELLPASKYSYMDDHPVVEQLLEQYAQQIAPANRVVGVNSQYRNQKQICQLVANLYCDKGLEKWGQEYDIVLGGGYISCRSPGYLSQGEVTYSQLQSLLPFDNQICLCSIKGRDLISKFLETDHSAYYIKTTAYGESIRTAIDPDGIYYVVTDSYSANYSYNNMTVLEIYADDIFARDLVAEYFEK